MSFHSDTLWQISYLRQRKAVGPLPTNCRRSMLAIDVAKGVPFATYQRHYWQGRWLGTRPDAGHNSLMQQASFFQSATSNWNKVPREGWLLGLLSASLSAAIDLTYWATHWPIGWTYVAPFTVLMLTWTGAIYVSACGISNQGYTKEGYVRFVLSTVTLLIPLGLTLLIIFMDKSVFQTGSTLALILLMTLVVVLIVSLFPAWPMAQAITLKSISPLRVFRATRGHRGSLIFISFTASAISNGKFIPRMATAQNFGEAALIGIGHIFVNLIAMALIASIAATAWAFAVRNDPGLG